MFFFVKQFGFDEATVCKETKDAAMHDKVHCVLLCLKQLVLGKSLVRRFIYVKSSNIIRNALLYI